MSKRNKVKSFHKDVSFMKGKNALIAEARIFEAVISTYTEKELLICKLETRAFTPINLAQKELKEQKLRLIGFAERRFNNTAPVNYRTIGEINKQRIAAAKQVNSEVKLAYTALLSSLFVKPVNNPIKEVDLNTSEVKKPVVDHKPSAICVCPKCNAKAFTLAEKNDLFSHASTQGAINVCDNCKINIVNKFKSKSTGANNAEVKETVKHNTIKTVVRETKVRTNQADFREHLLNHCNRECVISGSKVVEILEAAHITPADGNNDSIGNGLILRVDLHRLFDRYLISINPENNKVVVSQQLKDSEYWQYNNKLLKIKPNLAEIKKHYSQFKK